MAIFFFLSDTPPLPWDHWLKAGQIYLMSSIDHCKVLITGSSMYGHSVYRLHISICTHWQADWYWSGTQTGPFIMPGTCNLQNWIHNLDCLVGFQLICTKCFRVHIFHKKASHVLAFISFILLIYLLFFFSFYPHVKHTHFVQI